MDAQEEAYRAEACELLAELEASLLELEEYPEDMELIGRVFRAMHTIKGSGAMFGFDAIAAFTHNVETVFDLVREGKVLVTKELINLTLSAGDHIRDLLDSQGGGDAQREEEIIRAFRELIPESESGEDPPTDPEGEAAPDEGPEPSGTLSTYRIRFRPEPDIFTGGTNPVHLIDELRDMGECRVVAHTDKIPSLSDIDPESCYLFWDIILTTDQAENAIRDVFIFVEDECELSIDRIDDDNAEDADCEKIGEILLKRGDLSEEDLETALKRQNLLGEILVAEKVTSQAAVSSALMEQDAVRRQISRRKEEALAASIRVSADKLDDLVDLVGELVIAQARLSQKAHTMNDVDLVSIAEEIEMLTGSLRDNAMGMRMLQIGSTFSTFRRLVRDLSAELEKQIELTTSGEETELDKTVIAYLKDPLVHILRNSIDHGIELPEERREAGKKACGTVHLAAEHSGGNVLIRISDDGKGLDPEAIRSKALEKGLILPDADLTEKEINGLIFAPGFSTASQVSDISGRGVGMDVVKKSIEQLRGTIEVESTLGVGTTITLKLPLTLAIIEGLLVTLGEGFFIFPLTAVEECVELPPDEAARGTRFLNIRGELVPYIRLREEYAVGAPKPDLEQVVIMEAGGQRVGVVVDSVVGSQQAVIKKMGSVFKDAPDISGATILGNGSVALIVDVNKLLDLKL
ncbi:chemotaxis protein CheA [Desulfoluna spongiiphila]|uniref:Chemotaxis protein CheA n=1 Tax=Desulfoluna spongiiphila TaxID=419481 RepID=A0A1G5F5B3_9BACT|nr:chemotaxis protein CheA [Desulfoluna spongiiphila]SCY34412.1 two-component system, chemotaxis family, sensor kinase CheA [Desulfoluna spongiiphila]VVS94295.1 consensus disorder prediction [Desulfoluna spongiiphila]